MTGTKIKFTYLVLLVCITSLHSAQDFQGKAYYISKTSLDMSTFGRPNMSEDQRKRMEERLKSMFEKTFILHFNRTSSIYKQDEKLEAPGQGGNRFGAIMGGAVDGINYKNLQTKVSLTELELFGKLFLMKEELPNLQWKMTGETKQIGEYTCFKAMATQTWEDFDMSTLRNTDNNEKEAEEASEETAKATEVTAWYTMQIPVSQGPGNYWGLPGLILEVNTEKTTILCSKITLNPEQKETIKAPSKGKEVSREEYIDIAKEKFQEMRENFRRGRGGGGRRS